MSDIVADYEVSKVEITLDGDEAEMLAGLLSRLASPPDRLGHLHHELTKMFPESRAQWALVDTAHGERHVDPALIRWES